LEVTTSAPPPGPGLCYGGRSNESEESYEAARRWSGGEFARAVAIFTRQAALDPELAAQFQDEAMLHYIENKTIPEALERGHSLERPDELMVAIEARLKKGSW
jgi:hypothetical protein